MVSFRVLNVVMFMRTNNKSFVKLKDSIPNNKVNGAAGHRGFHALKHVVMEQEQDYDHALA